MSGLYSISKCMRLVLEMLIYEMLIKNSGISQIYEGKTAAAIIIINHESQSPFFYYLFLTAEAWRHPDQADNVY